MRRSSGGVVGPGGRGRAGGCPGVGATHRWRRRPLAVNAWNRRNVQFVAEGGNGLSGHGATRGKVTDLPNAGDYVAERSDPFGHRIQNQGLTWATFEQPSPSVRHATAGAAAAPATGQTVIQNRGGAATPPASVAGVVNAGDDGALSSGASTTFGFPGGTTTPVPSPNTRSTTP